MSLPAALPEPTGAGQGSMGTGRGGKELPPQPRSGLHLQGRTNFAQNLVPGCARQWLCQVQAPGCPQARSAARAAPPAAVPVPAISPDNSGNNSSGKGRADKAERDKDKHSPRAPLGPRPGPLQGLGLPELG